MTEGDGVPFQIVLAHLDGYARVKMRGDLDYQAVESHAAAIEELTALRRNVVIDLSEVTFMDSGGLSALVLIARDHDGPVRLEGLAPNVRRVLSVTGLERIFEIMGDDMEKQQDSNAERVPGPDDQLTADERMYTGEPVDTEDGPRRPQQMNVGAENMQGGGEWPDPNTPPSEGASGETARSHEG